MTQTNIKGFKRGHLYKLDAYSPFKLQDKSGILEDLGYDEVVPVSNMRKIRDFLTEELGFTMQQFQERIMSKVVGGSLLWSVQYPNLVTDEGETELLDRSYNGGTFTDYVFLTDGTPTFAEDDTMSSHAGWSEVTAYDEANRQDYVPGTASSQSIDNSASKATFTIDTNGTTIGGAGLTTDNTKGGSSGILIGGAAFSAGDKSIDDNDTLDVTITGTAS